LELSFRKGDLITFRGGDESGWAQGELRGKIGWFPISFVEFLDDDGEDNQVDHSLSCARCEIEPALKECTECGDVLCLKCGEIIHQGRLRRRHNMFLIGSAHEMSPSRGKQQPAILLSGLKQGLDNSTSTSPAPQPSSGAELSNARGKTEKLVELFEHRSKSGNKRPLSVQISPSTLPSKPPESDTNQEASHKLAPTKKTDMREKHFSGSYFRVNSESDMKMLLKITQEKFKNEVLTNKNLETHEDIVLNNPYKQVPAPSPPRPLPKNTGIENLTLEDIINYSNPYDIFEHIQLIGGGGFSQVYSAIVKSSRQKVAIKKMSLDDWHEQDLLVEIVMMKINTHQNIVSYIDTYKDDRNYIWVVMEFMEEGSLEKVIDAFPRIRMNEKQIICLF